MAPTVYETYTAALTQLDGLTAHEVLDKLLHTYHVDTSLTAALLRARPADVHSWKRENAPIGSANLTNLYELLALSTVLTDVGVDNIEMWVNTPLVDGYKVKPRNLYNTETTEMLLDYADGVISAEELLDVVDDTWRDDTGRVYYTVHAENRQPTLTFLNLG